VPRRSVREGRLWGDVGSKHLREAKLDVHHPVSGPVCWSVAGSRMLQVGGRLQMSRCGCRTDSASSAIRPVLALFSRESTLGALLWSPALLPAKLRDSSSLASSSVGSAVSSFGLCCDGQCVLTNDDKGVVQTFSTVQHSSATTMALNTGTTARTQTLRTATWVVKETQMRRVAGQPC
jgi:hypothetical protein